MPAALSRTATFLALLAVMTVTAGAKPSRAATVEVKDALRIELGTDFFNAMSDEVYRKELSKTERVRMDDVEDENGGAKVRASGISYILFVRGFHLGPRGDTLDMDFAIGDVNLHVDELQVKYKFLRTTCRNINVNVATGSRVSGAVALSMGISGDQIQLANRSVQFDIPETEYHTERPESCSGGLLSGVIKNAVERQLNKMRPKLEEKVRAQLSELAPKLQKKINERLLKTGTNPGEDGPVTLGDVRLSAIGVSSETFFVELGTKIEVSDAVAADFQSMPSGYTRAFDPTRFAWVGINTRLINLELAEAFPRELEYREIKLEGKPELQGLFTRENLGQYIEDLQTLTLDSENLKAAYRMDSPPAIDVTERGEIQIRVPRIDLKLQVLERGEWRDYFSFFIDVAPRIELRQLQGRTEFKIGGFDNVRIDGRWYEGYPRSSSRTELPQLSHEVGALLGLAVGENGTFSFRTPEFKFENLMIKPGLRARTPFIGLELSL